MVEMLKVPSEELFRYLIKGIITLTERVISLPSAGTGRHSTPSYLTPPAPHDACDAGGNEGSQGTTQYGNFLAALTLGSSFEHRGQGERISKKHLRENVELPRVTFRRTSFRP